METTIVLAEDEPQLRTLYVEWLRRSGFRVHEAADGGEALSQVQAVHPDLLIMDLWMPVLNGLEVVEHLARTAEAVGLRIVILSHQDDAETRLEGFALGIADYWTKDLTLTELLARIAMVLGSPSPGSEADVDA